MNRLFAVLFTALFCLTAFASAKDDITLLGAGATFPYPLYSKMFDAYSKEKGVQVNYQPIGSGGGIQQLISKTVDFGGTDAPMSDKETKGAKGDVLHIPTCLGAVVVTYNLPGDLKVNFTPEIIGDIFLGKITRWDDPKIAEANKGLNLPSVNIVVAHRSDGSGTTYTFSEYLSAVHPEWKAKVGTGKSLNWPAGLGGKGNAGVAGIVKQTPGAIGYVEVAYAKQNKMSYGNIQNKSGAFIEPTLASIAAAAEVDLPADSKVSLVNTAAPKGYPICTFTWIILYKEQNYGGRDVKRTKAVVDLIWWVTHEGQKYNETLDYGVLSEKAVKVSETILKSAVYDGKAIFK